MNLNKVFILGRLTRDPEQRTMPNSRSVSNFGMATNRIWTNQDSGEKQEQVEFHNIVAFGKLAEICSQYLKKGQLVLIEGRIQTRSWEGQDGNKKYRTEIVADNMQMGPKAGQPTGEAGGGAPSAPSTGPDIVGEVQLDEVDEKEKKSDTKKTTKKTKKEEPEEEIDVKDIPF